MANTYFRFKEFLVNQQYAAMKVCTDSCLFGAWCAESVAGAGKVLDIGAGTGLLSLMYAQKSIGSMIDAVEIDALAADEAISNFAASPWAEQLHMHTGPVADLPASHAYDLILTNPPFFENDLTSGIQARNTAMHSSSLTLRELSDICNRLLKPEGTLAVLLPYHRTKYFTELMTENGWHPGAQVSVRQSPSHSWFRSMLTFCRHQPDLLQEEFITIREADNSYSLPFTKLLKDYYLFL